MANYFMPTIIDRQNYPTRICPASDGLGVAYYKGQGAFWTSPPDEYTFIRTKSGSAVSHNGPPITGQQAASVDFEFYVGGCPRTIEIDVTASATEGVPITEPMIQIYVEDSTGVVYNAYIAGTHSYSYVYPGACPATVEIQIIGGLSSTPLDILNPSFKAYNYDYSITITP